MEIDVTHWAVIRPEEGGADQDKRWLAENPAAERADQWLWKPRQPTGDGSEHELSDVAEVVASQVAGLLGLPAAQCLYATRGDELGVISKNVTPADCDLQVGQIYLDAVEGYVRLTPTIDSKGYRRGFAKLDQGYTLDAVAEVLRSVSGPPGWERLSGMQVFSGFLVLDALIANTDRHPRNWAILEPWDGAAPMLAPAFDHGRALGSGLTERKRLRVEPSSFCRKGVARPFTPANETLVQLAHRAAAQHDAGWWIDRLRQLPGERLQEVVVTSGPRMSVAASTFMWNVLNENWRRLCDDPNAHLDGRASSPRHETTP